MKRLCLVLGALASLSCARPAPDAAPFHLSCAGSSTDTSGQVFCVRTDTRTGEVRRVSLDKLPVSNGPTAAAPGPAGLYETACAAVNMAQRSDFSCVRLNTQTGELLLINLTKVGAVPDEAP